MADEQVVGMNYFDHQFLRQRDFETAQNYHINRLRQHNRLLHLPGIVTGLEVARLPGTQTVRISLGSAVDFEHREVILRPTGDGEEPPLLRWQTATGLQETEVRVTGNALDIDLSLLPAVGTPVFLTIRQAPKKTSPSVDPGMAELRDINTRLVERAVIEASPTPAPPSGAQVLLAQINRNADGTIQDVDRKGRVFAGAWLADHSVTGDKIAGNTIQWEHLHSTLQSRVDSGRIGSDAVESAMIAEADATSGQVTNSGKGVKTKHLQDNAVTEAKLDSLVRNGLAAGFCVFDGRSGSLLNQHNVAGVSKLGTGRYMVRWKSSLSPDGPVFVFTPPLFSRDLPRTSLVVPLFPQISPAAAEVIIELWTGQSGLNPNVLVDSELINVLAFRTTGEGGED